MKRLLRKIFLMIPCIKDYYLFRLSISNRVLFKQYVNFKLRRDKRIYWPVHKTTEVTHPDNIYVGINSNPGTRPGCYLQGNGGIVIGNYVHFASNIGVISANHDVYDQTKHICNKVVIGDYCWIGQGVIIMPGVKLGPRTIVGAGSIVTKSFENGYCVIAGNPARKLYDLDNSKFKPTEFLSEYYGFIPKDKFYHFATTKLSKNQQVKAILIQ